MDNSKYPLVLVKLTKQQIAEAEKANGDRKTFTHALLCGPWGQILGTETRCRKHFDAWRRIFPLLFDKAMERSRYQIGNYESTFGLVETLLAESQRRERAASPVWRALEKRRKEKAVMVEVQKREAATGKRHPFLRALAVLAVFAAIAFLATGCARTYVVPASYAGYEAASFGIDDPITCRQVAFDAGKKTETDPAINWDACIHALEKKARKQAMLDRLLEQEQQRRAEIQAKAEKEAAEHAAFLASDEGKRKLVRSAGITKAMALKCQKWGLIGGREYYEFSREADAYARKAAGKKYDSSTMMGGFRDALWMADNDHVFQAAISIDFCNGVKWGAQLYKGLWNL